MEGKDIIRIFATSKHVLTIRVSFPRGQAVYVTTRLKPPSGGFLFPETLHQHFQKALTRSDISFDGNLFSASKYQTTRSYAVTQLHSYTAS